MRQWGAEDDPGTCHCGLVANAVGLLIYESRKNDYFNSKCRNVEVLIIALGHRAVCSACTSHK